MLMNEFRRNTDGGVAILFGLSALGLVGLIGGGVDLSRQQKERQIVGDALALTCQFLAKSSVNGNSAEQLQEARRFFETNWQAGRDNPPAISFDLQPGQQPGQPVTLVATGRVPTAFMNMVGIGSMQVTTQIVCPAGVAAPPTTPSLRQGDTIFRETFESGPAQGNTGWIYVRDYNGWTTTGEGLEISAGYKQGAPEGRNVGEFVADRSIAMTRRLTLRAGTYELRYWYAGSPWLQTAAYNTPYDPAPICANNTADVAWATADTTQPSRIGVYLSPDTPGWNINWMGMLPTNPAWRPTDLLETCVYVRGWVERSITIRVPSDGAYWITFAGQSRNGAPEGAQLDDIRLCFERCNGERQLAPFERPATVLFRDNFLSWPVGCCSISATAQGWNSYPNSFHEVWSGAWGGPSSLGSFNLIEMDNSSNSIVGRSLLLPQGTYELRYTYAARIKFGSIPNVPTCDTDANAPAIRAFPTGRAVAASGDWQNHDRNFNTNAMGVYIDPENGANRSFPSQIVDYCIYGGTQAEPVRRSIRFRVSRPDFYRFTFRGEGESDSVGALFSNVMICAVSCDATATRGFTTIAAN
jgi:hypothetical protein